MSYCCQRLEIEMTAKEIGSLPVIEEYNGSLAANGCCGGGCFVLTGIVFCPFCGTEVSDAYTYTKEAAK